jgi:hypothetical protein
MLSAEELKRCLPAGTASTVAGSSRPAAGMAAAFVAMNDHLNSGGSCPL